MVVVLVCKQIKGDAQHEPEQGGQQPGYDGRPSRYGERRGNGFHAAPPTATRKRFM